MLVEYLYVSLYFLYKAIKMEKNPQFSKNDLATLLFDL